MIRMIVFGLTAAVSLSSYLSGENLELFAPGNGVAQLGEKITIVAHPASEGIVTVVFSVDGEIVETDTEAPYAFEWTADTLGSFEIRARTTDSAGSVLEENVTITTHYFPAITMSREIANHSITSVIEFQDAFYALADSGIVFESSDLEDWEIQLDPGFDKPRYLGSSNDLVYAIGYSGIYYSRLADEGVWRFQRFDRISKDVFSFETFHVAVAVLGTGPKYYLSEDFLRWRPFELPVSNQANPQFLSYQGRLTTAAANDPSLPNSPWTLYRLNEELAWDSLASPDGGNLVGIIEDGDRVYGLSNTIEGASPRLRLYWTEDFADWNEQPIRLPANYADWLDAENWSRIERWDDVYALTYGLGRSNAFVLTTNDLDSTWSVLEGVRELYRIERVDESYYASGLAGPFQGSIQFSSNGVNWVDATPDLPYPVSIRPLFLSISSGHLIHNAVSGLGEPVFAKPNGTDWRALSPGYLDSMGEAKAYAVGNGIHVLLGRQSNLRSVDGKYWERFSVLDEESYAVAYGVGLFVAGGDEASVHVSEDAISWTTHTLAEGIASPVWKVFFLEETERFVATIGNSSSYWTSWNGSDWTIRESPGHSMRRINGALYVQAGSTYTQTVHRSEDGIDWVELYSDAGGEIVLPVFKNGVYVKAGNQNGISWSRDAINWKGTGVGVPHVTATGFGFVAGPMDGHYTYLSTNGRIWHRIAEGAIPGLAHTSSYDPLILDPDPIEGTFYSFGPAFKRLPKMGVDINLDGGVLTATVTAYGLNPQPWEQSSDLKQWEAIHSGNLGLKAEERTVERPKEDRRLFIRQRSD